MPIAGETLPSQQLNFLFSALVALTLGCAVIAVRRAGERSGEDESAQRRWALGSSLVGALWLLATAMVARSGWLLEFESLPPRLVAITGPALLTTFVLAFGTFGSRLIRGLPLATLIGYQVFRVPLELLLWKLHGEGVIPSEMTISGRNFDILTGLLALPVALLALRERPPRALILAWNVIGLALLVNIVVTAILCAPFPFRAFTEGPANTVVFHSPWVWLPGFLVPMALFGHLVVFRALLRRGD